MRVMKKIILSSLIMLMLLLTSCFPNNGNDNTNSDDNNLNLPNASEYITARKEEIIYVNIKQNGEVDTIKATNKIKDTAFSYYVDYGKFLSEGNLNITSGKGEIIIDNNKALIPSLDSYENFYYILSLDKEHYESLLPYEIEVEYKLNDKRVSYHDLVNKSGTVDMKILFKHNNEANNYFKNHFGAQIQIPFDNENVEIIESPNLMSKAIVGKTITLIYMAMPQTDLEINLKLNVKNFHFSGIEATYQEFNINDLINNFINFDDISFSDMTNLSEGIDLIVEEFSNVKEENQLNTLFNGLNDFKLDDINESINEEELMELETLVEALNNDTLKNLISSPINALRNNLDNKATYIEKYNLLNKSINDDIKKLTGSYYNVMTFNTNTQIDFSNSLLMLEAFDLIISNLELIKEETNNIFKNEFDLISLLEDKETLINTLNTIDEKTLEIKQLFQYLITNSVILSDNIKELFHFIEPLINLKESLTSLTSNLRTLVNEVRKDKENDVFSSSNINIYLLLQTMEEGMLGNPPMLLTLEEYVDNSNDDFEELDQLKELLEYTTIQTLEDEELTIKKVDALTFGFMFMNQALALPQQGQPMSFYDGLAMISSLKEILPLLPKFSDLNEEDIKSFLSNENLRTSYVQFIIKQQPF